MGIQPFNIASSVALIAAQRLARRLCVVCRQVVDIPRQTLLDAGFSEADLEGNWKPYQAIGCASCNLGFKGRLGIYQVMPVTDAIQRLILADASAHAIADQAQREGVRTLRQSGLLKVRQGLTSLEEILAVTNE